MEKNETFFQMFKRNIKEEMSWRLILPNHDTPHIFAASYWQTDKTNPNLFFLLYRSAYMVLFLGTLIWETKLLEQWGVYITMWGYTMSNLYNILSFEMLFVSFVFTKIFNKRKFVQTNIKYVYRPMWIVFMITVPLSLLITILYWTAVMEPDAPWTWDNFFIHGSNSILMILDLVLAAIPVRILQVVYPLGFGACYLIFSIIYHYIDLDYGGDGYVYRILNWGTPVTAALVSIGVFFSVIIFHFICFVIYQLKLMYPKKHFKDQTLQSLTV